LDFGIARSGDQQLTATGNVVGTPSFMSPEQLSGEEVGPPSDLWSLGMVTFKSLTGANPFERPSITETMGAVLHARMPTPTRYVPELPPSVDAWFARACSRDPAARFRTPGEMSEALWAALGVDKLVASCPSASSGPLSSVELTVPVPHEVPTEGTLRSTVGSHYPPAARAVTAPAARRLGPVLGLGVFAGLCVVGIALFAVGSTGDGPIRVLGASAPAVASRVRSIEIDKTPAPEPSIELAPEPAAKAPPRRAAPAPVKPKPKTSEDEDNLGF